MAKQRRSPDERSLVETIAPTAILTLLAVIPLWISRQAVESFRVPKEALFVGTGILAITLTVLHILRSRERWRQLERSSLYLTLAIILWTAVTTVLSPDRSWSSESLATVCAGAAFFIATMYWSRRFTLWSLTALILPGSVIAAVGIAQKRGWDPIEYIVDVGWPTRVIGTLGNSNDVGAFLVYSTIAAATLTVLARRPRNRVLLGGMTLFLAVGIAASGSLTAILTMGVALSVLAFRVSIKGGIAMALLGVTFFALFPSTVSRIPTLVDNARQGRYQLALSARYLPALIAIDMIKDHPLTGVGPGRYGNEYLDYGWKVTDGFNDKAILEGYTMESVNETTHNDHLQAMAEAGIPMGLMMWAAIAFVGMRARNRSTQDRDPVDERFAFATLVSLPFAIAFVLQAAAFFPLYVAATRSSILFLAGLTIGWSERE